MLFVLCPFEHILEESRVSLISGDPNVREEWHEYYEYRYFAFYVVFMPCTMCYSDPVTPNAGLSPRGESPHISGSFASLRDQFFLF